jgi:DNA-binding response OmpR family regulator
MAMERSSSQSLQAAAPHMSVLFVDPDVEGAQRLARAIAGVAATAVAPTAQAALHALRSQLPTLIVTEVGLPDASGIELLARIHANPATRRVLLMVVTSRTSIQEKIAAFQAGADDYLIKPLEPQQFLMHLRLLTRFRQVTGI